MPHTCQWPTSENEVCGLPAHNYIEPFGDKPIHWLCPKHYDFVAEVLRGVANEFDGIVGDVIAKFVRKNKLS